MLHSTIAISDELIEARISREVVRHEIERMRSAITSSSVDPSRQIVEPEDQVAKLRADICPGNFAMAEPHALAVVRRPNPA